MMLTVFTISVVRLNFVSNNNSIQAGSVSFYLPAMKLIDAIK